MENKGITPVVAAILLLGIAVASVTTAAYFLQGTMSDLQKNVEAWIGQEDRVDSSSISVSYGYNGTHGFLLVELRNDGSRTISLEERGDKRLEMFIDGIPRDWRYLAGSPHQGSANVNLPPASEITINTTEEFPSNGESLGVKFTGPYEINGAYLCRSEAGKCQG